MLNFFKNMWSDIVALNDPQPVQNISPDAMIINALMQSFASEFDDWKLEWREANNTWQYFSGSVSQFPAVKPRHKDATRWDSSKCRQFLLTNKKKNIEFKIRYVYAGYDGARTTYHAVMESWKSLVNNVEIDGVAGRQLADAYLKLKTEHDAAKAVAAKALADTKANEAKWDVVEKILDMKRTKTGRLIATSSYCAVCDSPDPEKEIEKLHNLSCPNRPLPKPRRPRVIKDPIPEQKVARPVKTEHSCDCDLGELCSYCE